MSARQVARGVAGAAAVIAVLVALAASYARSPWLHNAISSIPSLFV